jgi:hypothetical protein
MSRENPLWGAPRIHGELTKVGIKISEASVIGSIRRETVRWGVFKTSPPVCNPKEKGRLLSGLQLRGKI